jgi:hypothetical protein
VAFTAYYQNQDYDIVSAIVELPPLPPFEVDVSETDANVDSKAVGIKGSVTMC